MGVRRQSLPLAVAAVLLLFFFYYTSTPNLEGYMGSYDAPSSKAGGAVAAGSKENQAQSPGTSSNKVNEQYPESGSNGKIKPSQAAADLPAAASSAVAAAVRPTRPDPSLGKNNSFLVTFGDSYSWTKFSIYDAWPSKANPIGNPKWPGLTLAHGANWVGLLTSKHNSTFLYNLNFAWAGATTDNRIVNAGDFKDFRNQVPDLYVPHLVHHADRLDWKPEQTIVGVCMGINDIARTWGSKFEKYKEIQAKLLKSYFETVDAIYDTGIRQFFFMNVPPLQFSPTIINGDQYKRKHWLEFSEHYNAELSRLTEQWKKTHLDAVAVIADQNGVMKRLLADPKKYGISDNMTFGDDATKIWADGFHPNSHVHDRIAEDIANTVRKAGLQL